MRLVGTFKGSLVVAVLGVLFTLLAPQVLAVFTIFTLTQVIGLAILALSLALVWGYGGILCFGQAALCDSRCRRVRRRHRPAIRGTVGRRGPGPGVWLRPAEPIAPQQARRWFASC